MKRIKIILIMLCTLFLTSSCETYSQVYYDDYNDGVSYTTVVTYGTPYYYDGVIGYYFYRGLYYYPYLWNNVWYFRPYREPHPYGWRFVPDRHWRPMHRLGDHYRTHSHNFGPGHRDMGREYGRGGIGRPGNSRPDAHVTQPRPDTHPTHPNTNLQGGRPMGDVRGTNPSRPSVNRPGILSSSSTRITVNHPPVNSGGSVSRPSVGQSRSGSFGGGATRSVSPSRGMGGGSPRGGGRGR